MGIILKMEEKLICQQAAAEGINGGFEGFEKRLELEFSPCPPCCASSNGCEGQGLRALTRSQIEKVLRAARCTIVAELSNQFFDSYVLSESSLFVYPHKAILKTCGTTRLLRAVPLLVAQARQLSLDVQSCRYTRGCFIFPEKQPYPHSSFRDEVKYLDWFFGSLGGGSKSCMMGDATNGQKWHIYVASAARDARPPVAHERPIYTLEMCMTHLGRKQASQFYREECETATEMTFKSGIRGLLPNAEICDFAFDPCGYSMNSVEGRALSTIHVTPEDGASYASFETMGYGPEEIDLSLLVEKALCCFMPSIVSVAVHVSSAVSCIGEAGSWGQSLAPYGYMCNHWSCEDFPGGSKVNFLTFQAKPFLTNVAQAGSVPLRGNGLSDSIYREKGDKGRFKKFDFSFDCSCNNDSILASSQSLAQIVPTIKDRDDIVLNLVKTTGTEGASCVMDVGALLRLWKVWKLAMPRLHFFYAMKCNVDNVLLSLLSSLGAGSNTFSKAELKAVQDLGVTDTSIIFANPCKLPSHITNHAAAGTVHVTTFDSKAELHKIQMLNPHAEVVLCIHVRDVSGARDRLVGVKYGAEMEDWEELLAVVKYLGLQVVGVAFHVFDGGHHMSFLVVATAISSTLYEHFPPGNSVSIIAEPVCFFAEDPFTLVTQIFGTRVCVPDGRKVLEYIGVHDGISGSGNWLVFFSQGGLYKGS